MDITKPAIGFAGTVAFSFVLFDSQTSHRVAQKTVSGKRIGPVLKQIAQIVTSTEQHIGHEVLLHTVKVVIEHDTVIMDPKRLDTVDTMLRLVLDQYATPVHFDHPEHELVHVGESKKTKGERAITESLIKMVSKRLAVLARTPDGMERLISEMKQAIKGKRKKSLSESLVKRLNALHETLKVHKANGNKNAVNEIRVKMQKIIQEISLPDLNVGDILLVGKFKNRTAEIKSFKTDENGQPVAVTTKGEQKIFKPRIKKLMPEKKA